jgi:hypothetical protein
MKHNAVYFGIGLWNTSLLLLVCFLVCGLSAVLSSIAGSTDNFAGDSELISDQRVQDLVETRVSEQSEHRAQGDSLRQTELHMRRDAWNDAQAKRQSEFVSIYNSKGLGQRFREHFVHGVGNSLIGYGGAFEWRVVSLQGEVLKASHVTVRPKNSRLEDVLSLSNGLMLLGETTGAYFLSILACLVAFAFTRRLESPILRIVIAVLVGFIFETWRNTGYAAELQAQATYSSDDVGLVPGSVAHLLFMYLPISVLCLVLWPNPGSERALAIASIDHSSLVGAHENEGKST